MDNSYNNRDANAFDRPAYEAAARKLVEVLLEEPRSMIQVGDIGHYTHKMTMSTMIRIVVKTRETSLIFSFAEETTKLKGTQLR